MKIRKLTKESIDSFKAYLISEEKSNSTIEKYIRDVLAFYVFAREVDVTKKKMIEYKQKLIKQGYAVGSINTMISSINRFLSFLGWDDCKVKGIKEQRQIYRPEEKELTRREYEKLVSAAGDDERLSLMIQTICCTGIRVSELEYFTAEALNVGEVTVNCKNKVRTILIPKELKKKLKAYIKKINIKNGAIFISKNGNPLDRSNIWSMMKKLCTKANVMESKVFPHNLRKLFARTFHAMEKDIAKLADILGHSNINTTRIYIISTGKEHRKLIDKMKLVM